MCFPSQATLPVLRERDDMLSVLLDVHRSHLSNHDALRLSVVVLSSVVCAVSASAVCLCLPASLSSRLLPRSAVAARLRLPYLAAARPSLSSFFLSFFFYLIATMLWHP